MIKDFIDDIRNLPDDVVAVATIDGLVEWNIENIINQPIEGLLYDLNRDMATNYTRLANCGQRAINDIAMAKILAWLLKEREEQKWSRNMQKEELPISRQNEYSRKLRAKGCPVLRVCT